VILLDEYRPLAAQAASPKLRAIVSKRATSPRKNRVGGFAANPSGRISRRRPQTPATAPGCSPFAYKTASGRARWLSHDPIEEAGGVNLYGFIRNDPVSRWDNFGLTYTETCDWPDSAKTWFRQNACQIIFYANKWKVDPRVVSNSILEEYSGKGFRHAVQDYASKKDALDTHAAIALLEFIRGRDRNGDIGPGNINLGSTFSELEKTGLPEEWQGWPRLTTVERFQLINDYLLSATGTADIGARLQKRANDENSQLLINVINTNELLSLETNAWRTGPNFAKNLEIKLKENPAYVPRSGNDSECLKKRISFIEETLNNSINSH